MTTQRNDKEQYARFVETARALGCDENEAAFDEKLKAIAKPKSGDKPTTATGGNNG